MRRILRKVRFYNNLGRAFWQKRKKIFILGFILGIIFFFFAYRFLSSRPQDNTQKIGLVGKYNIQELPLEIQKLISNGLTMVTEDGSVKPFLAESWEIENDGKEYIFKLKENLLWQDKEPLIAKDVNLKFSDVTKTVIDDTYIKFQLKEPFSPFLAVVSKPLFRKGLLGTGDYKVSKVQRNGEIVESITLTPAKDKTQPKIIYKFYPTENAARSGFKLGEIDTLKEIVRVEDLNDWERIKITPEVKYNRFVAIFFNTDDPYLGNKSTRQALAYALKKDWEERALNPFNPSSWAYSNKVKPYNYDTDNAKKLLENGNGDTESEEEEGKAELGEFKEIELTTLSSLLPIAEEIKKDWEALGIATKIKVINNPYADFQALLATQEIPSDPDQYLFWHSTQAGNISRYKSPKIDKLLEDGRKTLDKTERKDIYFDFQKSIVEETPAVFLFHPTVYTISKD